MSESVADKSGLKEEFVHGVISLAVAKAGGAAVEYVGNAINAYSTA